MTNGLWINKCQKINVYEERVRMLALEIAETTGFKHCQGCSAVQISRDKFCRRCGVSQSHRAESLNCITGRVDGAIVGRAERSDYETKPLSRCRTWRRSYSGRLVSIVTQELSGRTSSVRANRWARTLVSLLVAVPLWLLIVLLSPLDAYVAANDLAKRV